MQTWRRMSIDTLHDLQLARLQATLRRAYADIPRWRDKFAAAGLHPDDIGSLAQLAKLPFTTKDDLRDAYPFGLFAVPMRDIVRLHASSGTTGRSTVVGYTAADIDIWSKLLARSLAAVGVTSGDTIQNAFGYGLFTGGLGWHYGAERLGAAVIPVSGGLTERQVRIIADFRPQVLMATPSYMLAIADECARQGIGPHDCSLRIAIFGAEPASEGMRTEIEARLGVEAFDSYGLSEVIGPGVAQECAGDKGALTLWEDHFLAEIVDPDSGEPKAEGEPGELVLTTLTRQAMPMIRYRTRDLTRLLPERRGPFRAIERIKGRTDDMLIVRGVNVFPSQIEALLTREPQLAPHYQLEVRRDGRLDSLEVRVECRPEAGPLDEEARRRLEGGIERIIRAHVGISVKAHVLAPGTLERSPGKARRVIDHRPKQ